MQGRKCNTERLKKGHNWCLENATTGDQGEAQKKDTTGRKCSTERLKTRHNWCLENATSGDQGEAQRTPSVPVSIEVDATTTVYDPSADTQEKTQHSWSILATETKPSPNLVEQWIYCLVLNCRN